MRWGHVKPPCDFTMMMRIHSLCAHFVPQRLRVLSARRRRWKDDHVHLNISCPITKPRIISVTTWLCVGPISILLALQPRYRNRWPIDHVYFNSFGTCRLLAAGLQDSSSYIHQRAPHRQIFAVHVSDEHSDDRVGGRHHQPQLSHASHAHDAALGPSRFPRRSVYNHYYHCYHQPRKI